MSSKASCVSNVGVFKLADGSLTLTQSSAACALPDAHRQQQLPGKDPWDILTTAKSSAEDSGKSESSRSGIWGTRRFSGEDSKM